MKKRIAIIIERADIVLGGAERSVFELSSALGALGHSVEVLAASGKTAVKNIKIISDKEEGKRVSLRTFQNLLKQYLSENHYDIIHSVLPFDFADVYQPRGGSYAEAAVRNAASYPNRLWRSYKRITSFANFRRSVYLRAEKKLCRNPNGPVVAALSDYVAWQFKEHYNLDDKRIATIANGVKVDKKPDKAQADKLRGQILAQLKLKEGNNPVLFLFVANNFRLKGLRPLLKALQLSGSTRTERKPCLVIAGRGHSGKYRLLAKTLGVSNSIVFLGNVRHIENALSITDVAILPTYYDPASRFILEALAQCKPVITTSFNGAVDLFEDGRHGSIIESPDDVESLGRAIISFCDTEMINNLSQAISDDNLKETISINRVARELDELYDQIIEARE